MAIVKEHLVDGVPISDLCDRHHLQPTQFYLWQKQLFENGADRLRAEDEGLRPDAGRASGRSAAGQARHQERGDRRTDGGERPLKKTRWGALNGRWVTHDVRDEVVDYVGKWSGRTELPAKQLVRWIGVGMSKFYDWRTRYGKVNEHNRLVPRDHWLEAWEREAILAFHAEHPLEGYRRLTYMMFELANNHDWRIGFGVKNWGAPAPDWMKLRGPRTIDNEPDWLEYGWQFYYALLNCGLKIKPGAGGEVARAPCSVRLQPRVRPPAEWFQLRRLVAGTQIRPQFRQHGSHAARYR